MKNLMKIAAASGLLICFSGCVVAEEPNEMVNPHRHPNLAAAQHLLQQASGKIHAAQVANEYELGGHAAKAQQLIDQAYDELKKAAIDANKEERER